MGVGVVAALEAEARTLGRSTKRMPAHAILPDGRLVAVSGIGCAAAELAARRLVEPGLCAGSIILPRELISRDGVRFVTSTGWRERLVAALSTQQRQVTAGTL